MARRYPKEFHDFVRENVEGRTTADLTALVNERFKLGVTESMMKAYKTNHHLKSGTPTGRLPGTYTKAFPKLIYDYIMANYKGVGHKEMADKLNQEFGTDYTATRIKSFYGNHHLDSGLTGQMEPGHVPFNKGLKGWSAPGTERTRFQKGNLPWTTKPIGYERISKDGYVEVKVRMRPSRPDRNDNFVAKHRLIWIQHHGPIPDGCVVIFKDGDKRNFDPDNLALVTMAERLEMARKGLFSKDPELTEAGIMVAKVMTTASKRKKDLRKRK